MIPARSTTVNNPEHRIATAVLVIGTGGSGLHAAIELAEPRTEVLAVGKRPKVDATNPSLLAESMLRIQNSEQEPHLRPHDAAEAALAA